MEIFKKTICLVDDDKDLLDSFVPILQESYEVRTFLSPEEALRAFDQGYQSEIVVTDLRMGRMNGFDFIEQMKRRSLTSKVILSSGHADKSAAIKALQCGVNGILEKPFTVREFRKVLTEVEDQPNLHESVNLIQDLQALNSMYFKRLAQAENCLYENKIEYPSSPLSKMEYLDNLKEESLLNKKVEARLKKVGETSAAETNEF